MACTDTAIPPDLAKHRKLVTVAIMLATVMQTLDSTIANVALPHMAGNLSASQDQIYWVLTSYIVAAAIATPLTGWMSGRFGHKRIFLISVVLLVMLVQGGALNNEVTRQASFLATLNDFKIMMAVTLLFVPLLLLLMRKPNQLPAQPVEPHPLKT